MAPGFSVYLNTLGKMAKSMDGAADAFTDVAKIAAGPGRIAENALGFFGTACAFPQKYKSMCDNVSRGASDTSKSFTKAANEFLALEKRYAAQDDMYANKFGIEADNIKPNIPKLDGNGTAEEFRQHGKPGPAEPKPKTPVTPIPNAPIPPQPKLPAEI